MLLNSNKIPFSEYSELKLEKQIFKLITYYANQAKTELLKLLELKYVITYNIHLYIYVQQTCINAFPAF